MRAVLLVILVLIPVVILTRTVLFVTAMAIRCYVMHNLVSVLPVKITPLVITVSCVLKDFTRMCLVNVFHVHALSHQDQDSLVSSESFREKALSVWIVHLAILVMIAAGAFQDTLVTLYLGRLAQTVLVMETSMLMIQTAATSRLVNVSNVSIIQMVLHAVFVKMATTEVLLPGTALVIVIIICTMITT